MALIEPRPLESPDHYHCEVVCSSERLERCFVADKDVPCLCRGAPPAEIINDGISHVWQKGQRKVSSRFGLTESDVAFTPVDIIQTEFSNVAWPQPVSCRKKEYGVVPSAQCIRTVRAAEDFGNFGFGEYIMEPRVAISFCSTNSE
jgi:hypothetical protein